MTRILIPQGIGDAYWVMVKLRGFLKERGIEMPDVCLHQDGGPMRSQAFIESVPFVRYGGYHRIPISLNSLVHEAYRTNGRTVFTEVPGVDYYIAYNGVLGAGRSLADVDPTFGTEWRFPLTVSDCSLEYQHNMTSAGPYVAAYFPDGGLFRNWWSNFRPKYVQESLERIRTELDVRIVHFGAEWDKGSTGWMIAESQSGPRWENFIGKTTYHELVGLLRGATAVVGYPSGATILPTIWNVPTAILWSTYFVPEFWRNVIAPDARYVPIDVKGLTVDHLVSTVRSLVRESDAHTTDGAGSIP